MAIVKVQFDSSNLKQKFEVTPQKAFSWSPEYGSGCSDCPVEAETPLYATVTFSGVSICPCFTDSGKHYKWRLDLDINDTFLLTQSGGDPCVWRVEYADSLHLDEYNDADCLNFKEIHWTMDFSIGMTRNYLGLYDIHLSAGGVMTAVSRDVFVGRTNTNINYCLECTLSNVMDCSTPVVEAGTGGSCIVQEGKV